MAKNGLIVNDVDRSIDQEVSKLLLLAAQLEALGVSDAATELGERYLRDPKTGDTVVASRDVIVKRTRATLGVLVALPGASKDDVLADLTAFTQEMQGTVVGRCQSWVSQRAKD
ncbi:hypothetical protein [Burkholderia contaminans]|uniref:hypothetical protein n=1 Tax=Burkholderia contaminans TaxID=488447 RepID=UPI003D66F2B9